MARRTAAAVAAAVGALAVMCGVGLTTHITETSDVPALVAFGAPASLPLGLDPHDARQVITVVAESTTAATAQLQAWEHGPDGWVRMGHPVIAHVAEDGLTPHPRENYSATPLGDYTLTQAFGKLPDPGTVMPYIHVTTADWWISQPGPLYNTHQFCTLACPFTLGSPNTHLVDAIRAYNYAVAIDYNRFPAAPGAGSAYFLHVTTAGKPTRGCIAIPQRDMIAILRWLNPSDAPRIMIGLAQN